MNSPAREPATGPGVSNRSGNTPIEEVAGGPQLGVGDRGLADPVQLVEELRDRRDGDLGVDGGAGGERAARAAEVEAGRRAVGVALLLAQVHVEPRVEQPAEDRAHHRDRVVVGVAARQPAVADPDLGLDGARPVDRPGRRARPGRRVSSIGAARRRASPRPVAEQPLREAHDLARVDVAGDDEGRAARDGGPRMDRAQLRRGEPRDGVRDVPPDGRWYGLEGA